MSNCNPIADDRRILSLRDVNYRIVLYVGIFTYSNVVAVATQHTVEPDAGVFADVNVPNYMCAVRYERSGCDLWTDFFIRFDHFWLEKLAAR